MKQKIHFTYEPNKQDIEEFAHKFTKTIGQNKIEDADIIVSIGGDGSVLHAFNKAAKGQKCYGVILPDSNSRGFWTNRGINSADDLIEKLSEASNYKIHPLKAEVTYGNGSNKLIKAFNEFSPYPTSGQSMLVNLSITSNQNKFGPIRMMGDGLILSTAFGSTAINSTYGGPSIDIRNSGIVFTGKGIYEPSGGFSPIVATEDTEFNIDFLSSHKRPVAIGYDGKSLESPKDNPIVNMTASKDHKDFAEILLNNDPSTRAFAALSNF